MSTRNTFQRKSIVLFTLLCIMTIFTTTNAQANLNIIYDHLTHRAYIKGERINETLDKREGSNTVSDKGGKSGTASDSKLYVITGKYNLEQKKLKAKHDEAINFSIVNVNPFIYDTSVEVKGISLNADVPAVFKAISGTTTTTTNSEKVKDNKKEESIPKNDELVQNINNLPKKLAKIKSARINPENIMSACTELIIDTFWQQIYAPDNPKKIVFELTSKAEKIELKYNIRKLHYIDLDNMTLINADIYILKSEEIKSRFNQLNLPKDINLDKSIKDIIEIYEEIGSAPYEIYVGSQIATEDIYEYTVITQKTKKPGEKTTSKPITRKIEVTVVGGWKLDFSYGVFFNGLTDRSYRINSNNVERYGEEDDYSPKIGAIAHAYIRKSYWPPISFGISQNESGKDLVYYLGISHIFGNKKRLILSAGAAGGQVKRLKGLKTGDTVPADTKEAPTKDVFKVAPFVAVTFNF